MLRTLLALASIVLAMNSGAAFAASDMNRILKSVTPADIVAVSEEIGATAKITKEEDPKYGTEYDIIYITFENGLKSRARLICSGNICTGIDLTVFFSPPSDMSELELLQMIDKFDYARTAVSAGLTPDGEIIIGRYIIIDHGVSFGSLVVNLRVFSNIIDQFRHDDY